MPIIDVKKIEDETPDNVNHDSRLETDRKLNKLISDLNHFLDGTDG